MGSSSLQLRTALLGFKFTNTSCHQASKATSKKCCKRNRGISKRSPMPQSAAK